MNNNGEKLIGTRERDDTLMNFAVRQAQEAILNPNLPEVEKDTALETAISTIHKVAERKAAYYAKYGEGRRIRKPRIIYEAPQDEETESIPPIIAELNENLKENAPEGMKDFSVEWIAERAGIKRSLLYEWVESDPEFTTALERLKDVQQNDPFKTGTDEDVFVNAMTIALLLLETKERRFKDSGQ